MKFYGTDLLPDDGPASLPADFHGPTIAAVIDALPDGIAILSLDGVVRAANRAFERFVNRTAAELQGRPLVPPGVSDQVLVAIEAALARTKPFETAGPLDSGRVVAASLRILRDDGGRAFGAVAILADPSARGRASERRSEHFRFRGDGHDLGPVYIDTPETDLLLRQGTAALERNVRVMLTGESGTGKTELARRLSERVCGRGGAAPFVHVNCGSIPESLFESEMFGYEPGAFTGAAARGKTGYVEAAENGVLFLDEVGEIPLHVQAKLLTFLEDGTFMRVGSPARRRARVRIVSATNRHLPEMIAAGTFRRDLYYRLAVVSLACAPLSGRREVIRRIAESHLKRINLDRSPRLALSAELWDALLGHDWPGNIRELSNVLEHVAAVAEATATPAHLPADFGTRMSGPGDAPAPPAPGAAAAGEGSLREALRDYEDFLIARAIDRHGSKRRAAKALGVDIGTLVRKTTRRSREAEPPEGE